MIEQHSTPCKPVLFVVIACLLGLLFMPAAAVSATPKPPTFNGAEWIWHKGADKAAGTWCFQKGFTFPAGQKPKKAHVLITCDNLWTLHVNGKQVGRNDSARNSWKRPQSVDVTKHLVIEMNAIAIEGTNTIPGVAGLLVKLVVEFEDVKETFELVSDKTWISASKPAKGWKDNGFVAGLDWGPVTVIGAYGMSPWGKVRVRGGGGKARRAPKPAVSLPLVTDKEELAKPFYADGVVFVGSAVGLKVNRQPIF